MSNDWMVHRKKTRDQRSDPAVARAVIDAVFSPIPREAKESYLRFLGTAIGYLSRQQPNRWGLSLFELEKTVRLNAGLVECLVLHPDGLQVLVEKRSSPAGTKLGGRGYRRAPGCFMTWVPLIDLHKALPLLVASHEAALSIAVRCAVTPAIRNAHSTGVTAYLSEFLHHPIPNPAYTISGEPWTLPEFDEVPDGSSYSEGRRIRVLVNRFERDLRARKKCIDHYGLRCLVCNMSFRERYGDTMRSFIHVHHLVPLSDIDASYQADPVADLRPVCPNCHAAIHREWPPLSIEQARALIR